MRLGVVLLLVAAVCGPAATRPTGSPAATAALRASPTPIFNVDDMMGGSFSPATVFAHVGNEIAAVKLQNHFVPFRIPVSGKPHAVVSPDGSRLYVADRKDGRTRVRAFDAATGVEVSSAALGDEALADDVAIAQDRPDRLLLLVKAGTGVRVDAVGTSALGTAVALYKSPCGDRILASANRVAVVCYSAGMMSIGAVTSGNGPLEGPQGGMISVPGAPIVASAMLADGGLVIGTTSGKLHRVNSGARVLVDGPELPGDSTMPEAIVAADDQRFVVLARTANGATASTYDARSGVLNGGPFVVATRVRHAVALWPFAYFAGPDPGLWHVDLRSGLVERMAAPTDAVPLTVSAR